MTLILNMTTIQTIVLTYPIVNTIQTQVTSVFKYFHPINIIYVTMEPDIKVAIVDVDINLNKDKISKKHIIQNVVRNVTDISLLIGASIAE